MNFIKTVSTIFSSSIKHFSLFYQVFYVIFVINCELINFEILQRSYLGSFIFAIISIIFLAKDV